MSAYLPSASDDHIPSWAYGVPGDSAGTEHLRNYVDVSVDDACQHFLGMLGRAYPAPGKRQVVFNPTETLLCLAASFLVDHSRFGSGSASRAPEPVQLLARLFKRPPTSILAKMANLDGTRSHGARWDRVAGAVLRSDPQQFAAVYRTLLGAARSVGITTATLPDFLGLENGGQLELLGQDEVESSVVEREVEWRLKEAGGDPSTEAETVQIVLAAARVGQHRFATQVLQNCGQRCVFCGFSPSLMGAKRMLIASHIKPWRDSDSRERLDVRNGLAACPIHDTAFDTGLLTVNGGLRIHVSSAVTRAAQTDPLVDHYFARPPLGQRLLLPEGADEPDARYLEWHHDRIFVAQASGAAAPL